MKNNKEFIDYRIKRAKETYDDALLLAENQKWNSAINRLYYAVSALLMNAGYNSLTHNGTKMNFSSFFIKSGTFNKETGKMFSQLFGWRQKGDYDDLFDFSEEKVMPYLEPVKNLIEDIEKMLEE